MNHVTVITLGVLSILGSAAWIARSIYDFVHRNDHPILKIDKGNKYAEYDLVNVVVRTLISIAITAVGYTKLNHRFLGGISLFSLIVFVIVQWFTIGDRPDIFNLVLAVLFIILMITYAWQQLMEWKWWTENKASIVTWGMISIFLVTLIHHSMIVMFRENQTAVIWSQNNLEHLLNFKTPFVNVSHKRIEFAKANSSFVEQQGSNCSLDVWTKRRVVVFVAEKGLVRTSDLIFDNRTYFSTTMETEFPAYSSFNFASLISGDTVENGHADLTERDNVFRRAYDLQGPTLLSDIDFVNKCLVNYESLVSGFETFTESCFLLAIRTRDDFQTRSALLDQNLMNTLRSHALANFTVLMTVALTGRGHIQPHDHGSSESPAKYSKFFVFPLTSTNFVSSLQPWVNATRRHHANIKDVGNSIAAILQIPVPRENMGLWITEAMRYAPQCTLDLWLQDLAMIRKQRFVTYLLDNGVGRLEIKSLLKKRILKLEDFDNATAIPRYLKRLDRVYMDQQRIVVGLSVAQNVFLVSSYTVFFWMQVLWNREFWRPTMTWTVPVLILYLGIAISGYFAVFGGAFHNKGTSWTEEHAASHSSLYVIACLVPGSVFLSTILFLFRIEKLLSQTRILSLLCVSSTMFLVTTSAFMIGCDFYSTEHSSEAFLNYVFRVTTIGFMLAPLVLFLLAVLLISSAPAIQK